MSNEHMLNQNETPSSGAELEQFRSDGFVGPFAHPLLENNPTFVDALIEKFRALEPTTAMPARPDVYRERLSRGLRWWRSMHLEIPELWDLARHPVLLDRLQVLLGPDVLWGGAFLATLEPGDSHGWHFDSEFHHAPGIAVFVAMRNVNEHAAVSVIAGSHRIGKQPSLFLTDGVRGDLGGGQLSNDAAVLAAAQTKDPAARLITPKMKPGDVLIADGRLWHGVRNSTSLPRSGMVFFFAPPTTKFRIVVAGDAEPVFDEREVSCAMLVGDGTSAANKLVQPPTGVEPLARSC